jgi:hypothetical protein
MFTYNSRGPGENRLYKILNIASGEWRSDRDEHRNRPIQMNPDTLYRNIPAFPVWSQIPSVSTELPPFELQESLSVFIKRGLVHLLLNEVRYYCYKYRIAPHIPYSPLYFQGHDSWICLTVHF